MSKASSPYWSLAGWCALTLGAGFVGSFLSGEGVRDWYPTIRKPTWTPPNAVFGPVWTVLYLLMAGAAWRVGRSRPGDVSIGIFLIQLVLNTAWSWFFFGLRKPGLALLDLAILWVAILATTFLFFKRDRIAGILLVPYLAWVSFAGALNVAFWQLNRT